MTPDDLYYIQTHAYRVKSECGREWEVPMRLVMEDYIKFRIENDSVDRKQALEEMDRHDVEHWFGQMYVTWDDIDRDGTLVKHPTQEDIDKALDALRRSGSPMNDSKLITSGREMARIEHKKIQKKTSRQALAPAARPRRM